MVENWHEFFLMVGGGAAALAGLVFVAVSINVATIMRDATHRSRAMSNLAGFAAAFMICGFGLMVQDAAAFGLEWLMVSLVASAIFWGGYFWSKSSGVSPDSLSVFRLIGGGLCYVAQIIGSILLTLGNDVGLYIAAIALIIQFAFMISGAWLLIAGIHQD